jgi:hypothetical protein
MSAEKRRMLTAFFRDHANAQSAYEQLLHRGYHDDEIAMIMSDTTRSTYFVVRDSFDFAMAGQPIESDDSDGVGAEIAPRLATVLAAAAAVTMPGMTVITAGALGPRGEKQDNAEFIATLAEIGVPLSRSESYEDALRNSGIVLGVAPHSSSDARQVRHDFEALHGEGISYFRG